MAIRPFLTVPAALGFVPSQVISALEPPLGIQIVDAMDKVFGVHPEFRAAHAKGLVAEGGFKGAREGPALSRAPLFAGGTIPVTVRLSDNGGLPTVPVGSPLRASLDELQGLPSALIITDENDVLQDEGEAYARKLSQAGVRVTSTRYNGTIHDFVMLNPLADTPATRGAIQQANDALREALHRRELSIEIHPGGAEGEP
jgi:acetyl esterase/lipase